MDFKTKITRSLRSSTSDKTSMDQQILKLHKNLKEVEKVLNRGRNSGK